MFQATCNLGIRAVLTALREASWRHTHDVADAAKSGGRCASLISARWYPVVAGALVV
jgi:hypothetical protein